MSQEAVPFSHPMVRAIDGVAELLDQVAGSDPMFLTTREKERVLVSIESQIARLESLRARTLAAADDVAEHTAPGRPVPGWPTRPGRTAGGSSCPAAGGRP